jgi:tetratricopeptide (TPR) repeat protein
LPSCTWPAPIATPLGELLGQARRRLDAGQPEAAYRLLEPRTALYAGSVDFDYLLGLAALDAGRPGEAVLALERVLAAEPGHRPARAEIGRAYLQLRELESARRELETVARSELPPQVRATDYRGLRTETLPADGRFVWLDDAPEQGELAMLRGRGWLDRWLFVDTREEPDDLLRAQRVLSQRLGGKAQGHGA